MKSIKTWYENILVEYDILITPFLKRCVALHGTVIRILYISTNHCIVIKKLISVHLKGNQELILVSVDRLCDPVSGVYVSFFLNKKKLKNRLLHKVIRRLKGRRL